MGISLWNTFCTEQDKNHQDMKKILLFTLCLFALTVWAMPHKVAFKKLPLRSQHFVEQYFPQAKVISVELDRRSPSAEKYSVYFADGNEIEFDGGSGDYSQIVIRQGSLPMDVLPDRVAEYLRSNYPNVGVKMVQRLNDGYRLQLDNGSAIDFSKDGRRTESVGTE